MATRERSQARFAEDVALLYLLSHVPAPPSDNRSPYVANSQDSDRILSFDRERTITSGLAFLAGISDEPNHVVALSVEERKDKQGITLVVAINKERPQDSEDILSEVKQGLQMILDVLTRVKGDFGPLVCVLERTMS